MTDSKGNLLNFVSAGPPPDFNISTTYNSGQYAKVPPPADSIEPDRVFVCIKNGTVGKEPFNDKTSWIMDSCPKNISGCRARFGPNESNYGLPFGGFPGSWEQ